MRKTVLAVAVILAIGLMGVGYAKWNGGIGTQMTIETGLLKPAFIIEDEAMDFEDEYLDFSLSEDGLTLYIEGKIFPDFDEDIPIKIADEGSVPALLSNLDEDEGEITALKDSAKSTNNIKTFAEEDYIESFALNICPANKEADDEKLERYSVDDELSGLEADIKRLKQEIKLYKSLEQDYEFEYKLSFEQDT